MRTNSISTIIVGSMVPLTALGVPGCGSRKQEAGKPPAAEINDGTFEKADSLDCAADGKSLNIGGCKNTLTVRGNFPDPNNSSFSRHPD